MASSIGKPHRSVGSLKPHPTVVAQKPPRILQRLSTTPDVSPPPFVPLPNRARVVVVQRDPIDLPVPSVPGTSRPRRVQRTADLNVSRTPNLDVSTLASPQPEPTTEPSHPYEGLSYEMDDEAIDAALAESRQVSPATVTPQTPTRSLESRHLAPQTPAATAPSTVDRSETASPESPARPTDQEPAEPQRPSESPPVGLQRPVRGSTVDVQRSPSPQGEKSSPTKSVADSRAPKIDEHGAPEVVEGPAETGEHPPPEVGAYPTTYDSLVVSEVETPVAVDRMEATSSVVPEATSSIEPEDVPPQQVERRVEQSAADTPPPPDADPPTEQGLIAAPGAAIQEIEVRAAESSNEKRIDRSFVADQSVETPAALSQVESSSIARQPVADSEVNVAAAPGPLDITQSEVVVSSSADVATPPDVATQGTDSAIDAMRTTAPSRPTVVRAASEEVEISNPTIEHQTDEPPTASVTTSASERAEPQPLDISIVETFDHPTQVSVDRESFDDGDLDLDPLPPATPTPLVGEESACLLYTSPSPRDATLSRMPSSA